MRLRKEVSGGPTSAAPYFITSRPGRLIATRILRNFLADTTKGLMRVRSSDPGSVELEPPLP